MLKRMAECAWQTTCAHLEDCETPADVALTFEIAISAIAEYQALHDEFEFEDNSNEVEMVDLDGCPGYQYLLENGEK